MLAPIPLNIVIQTLLALIVGIALYLLRCRRPIYYGVLEVLLSIITLVITFSPITIFLTADSSSLPMPSARALEL
jgi:hypothetical protein